MSSSIATVSLTGSTPTIPVAGANSMTSNLVGNRQSPAVASPAVSAIPPMATQFREIHKNTWLKRLTAEGKKVFVGPKKSERSWVVFCVHDDTEAMLEGYAEPRQAPSHNPEWVVPMQDTLHISHALIPNSHEFEFVVTLSNEVVRFHAMSWDIMQEWVETLRSKLREMKILSPRENLYTKLPEVRIPLLPTRDPTSPLPAPPPVPAAIVPGVERVVPPSVHQQQNDDSSINETRATNETSTTSTITSSTTSTNNVPVADFTPSTSGVVTTSASSTNITPSIHYTTPLLTSMSNTLTQNLLNMLSDPISAYSEQLNDANSSSSSIDAEDELPNEATATLSLSLEKELNLSETQSIEEGSIGPLLRNSRVNTSDFTSLTDSNSVRVDVFAAHRASADHIRNLENILQCERRIPRPHTSRSLSAGAVDKSKIKTNVQLKNEESYPSVLGRTNSRGNNITELEINSETIISKNSTTAAAALTTATSADTKSNITIIKVSTDNGNDETTSTTDSDNEPPTIPSKPLLNAEIFTFPEMHLTSASSRIKNSNKQHEYKSNVQIIPSGSGNSNSPHLSSSAIQVIRSDTPVLPEQSLRTDVVANQYTTPVKKAIKTASGPNTKSDDLNKITTVHVTGKDNQYGSCFSAPSSGSVTSTPKLPKKIILSANTSGITNISVNANEEASLLLHNNTSKKDEELSTSSVKCNSLHYEKVFLASSSSTVTTTTNNSPITDVICLGPSTSQNQNGIAPMSPAWISPVRQASQSTPKVDTEALSSAPQFLTTDKISAGTEKKQRQSGSNQLGTDQVKSVTKMASPAMQRRPTVPTTFATAQSAIPMSRHLYVLTRGLTEAVITTRPSRRDFLNKLSSNKSKMPPYKSSNVNAIGKSIAGNANNNGDANGPSTSTQTPTHLAISRTTSDAIEQRRRSSSTSDAQGQRNSRNTNNNEFSSRNNGGALSSGALRQPPQPIRDNLLSGFPNVGHNSNATSPAKRMTLREQQVMQLRREIMHPGGVRLQLRRKDCVGSIAWVEAFGGVWVAGWKQKEHPVLYNALHIGDQLLSIAGVTISSAAEANKIIRNTNTLFVEVLVRRIPFGRGYAVRREREGQCLGLIRDGNTATIVDVVPNSLAARHGLPPKAQSCDGSTLTFWVLTEINGRPLNLFFKDNEIRDRLNSVGRDISILVQPSDLITKLKKQLKSLRGYKDYLVQ